MIQVSCRFDSDSVLREVKISGHAGFNASGKDIVCSAVTILGRTFARLVEAQGNISWKPFGLAEGLLAFQVVKIDPEARIVYEAWCDFFVQGIRDLISEFPDNINLEVIQNSGRSVHGS